MSATRKSNCVDRPKLAAGEVVDYDGGAPGFWRIYETCGRSSVLRGSIWWLWCDQMVTEETLVTIFCGGARR
jgi:hypothetical protein